MFRFFGAATHVAAIGAILASLAFAEPIRAYNPGENVSFFQTVHEQVGPPEGMTFANAPNPALSFAHDVHFAAPVIEHAVADLDEHLPAAPLEPIDAMPAEKKPLSVLVALYGGAETRDAEHECLATAVYFESKGEPLEGQLAVADVVMNRAESSRFPDTLCGVVKQKSQFSFVRGGRFPAIKRASAAWRNAVAIADIALQGLATSRVGEAMFFHARYVSPNWKRKRAAQVGNHIFYY